MKKLAFLAISMVVTISMSAQRFDVGVNFMTGLPMGDYNVGDVDQTLSTPPGFGIGGGIEANYWFNDNFSAGLEVGYLAFGEAENTELVPVMTKATAVPIIVNAHYYFMEDNIRPYAGVGVGYLLYNFNQTIEFLGTTTGEWAQNGLVVSPRVGCLFGLSDALDLNLDIQYNLAMNKIEGDHEITIDGQTGTNEDMRSDATNYLGINLGILFKISE